MPVEARVTDIAGGAIVHDPTRLGAVADPGWFDAEHWRQYGAVTEPSGGRGSAWRVMTRAGAAILRHYRRGGLVAHFNHDSYFFTSGENTRAFREFALLRAADDAGLPAPRPLAARYVRDGFWYRADILVAAVEHAVTLADALVSQPAAIDWAAIGRTIARFHAAGFFHADLNAHNVLLREDGVWLIDFDRGERRAVDATWPRENLDRLHRSLVKLEAPARVREFEPRAWVNLVAAHAQGIASSTGAAA